MKRIAIFCDGTWNDINARWPTNVVLLAEALRPTAGHDVKQIPLYVPGVGTGRGVARHLDRLIGGAFGIGLLANIEEAYRHLAFIYEPGDEIFIFGFSRGAYTARSLTGLIRSSGILARDRINRLGEAIDRYRDRDERTHPETEESYAFRLELSPQVVTSAGEAAWREAQGAGAARLLRIDYLGVWDTVGALGVPRYLGIAPVLNRKRFAFHDAQLSSMVAAARHAIALDERRRSFEPTRWANLDELNAMEPRGRFHEMFFAGDHGSVGGGGDIEALSSIALAWIAEGAIEAGLELDEVMMATFAAQQDPMGPLSNRSEPPPRTLVNVLTRLRPRDREGPARLDELHPSVVERYRVPDAEPPYRPGSLRRVAAALERLVAGGR